MQRYLKDTASMIVGLAAVCSVVVAGPALAVNFSWVPAGGGAFETAGNWTPAGGPPTTGDIAIYDNEATGTVTFAADRSINEINFRNDAGALTFDLGGKALNLVAANGMRVGSTASNVNNITFINGAVNGNATGNNLIWSTANLQNNKLTYSGAGVSYTSASTSSSTIASGAGSAGNVLRIDNGATYNTANNFLIGPTSATTTSNSIDVVDATLNITNGNRGFVLTSGALNVTNSTVSSGYIGAATTAAASGLSGTVNFNSGTLSTRFFRATGSNTFFIGDGGAIDADFRMVFSAPIVDAPNGVVVRSNGSIGGTGTINGNVSGSAAGAQLIVSPNTAPTGTATTTINGNFDASNFDILLKLGDFPTELANDQAVPQPFSAPFDQVIVNGLFTQAAAITIDLASYVAPEDMDYELQVLGWTSTTGPQLAPIFINGGPLDYEYRANGLYITAAVPEPASLLLLAAGGALMLTRRRRA